MQMRSDSLVLLGLCPLLGATQSLAAAIALGLVAAFVVVLTEILRLATVRITTSSLQMATEVMLWAGSVTAADLALQSWWSGLQRDIGLFLPLLLAAGLLSASARGTAQQPASRLLSNSAVFLGAAFLLGTVRELVGQGSLFATGQLLLEPLSSTRIAGLSLFGENRAFLIAIMPPGAFIAAGLLLAARNALQPGTGAGREA